MCDTKIVPIKAKPNSRNIVKINIWKEIGRKGSWPILLCYSHISNRHYSHASNNKLLYRNLPFITQGTNPSISTLLVTTYNVHIKFTESGVTVVSLVICCYKLPKNQKRRNWYTKSETQWTGKEVWSSLMIYKYPSICDEKLKYPIKTLILTAIRTLELPHTN